VRTAGECDHIQILKCIICNLFHPSLGCQVRHRFARFGFESICWPLVAPEIVKAKGLSKLTFPLELPVAGLKVVVKGRVESSTYILPVVR
jgi:hypothetical protein